VSNVVVNLVILVGLVVGSLMLYFAPWIIGAQRHVPNVSAVIMINVFLGWTMIGWLVALNMACNTPGAAADKRQPRMP
jgi:hypothetical protein